MATHAAARVTRAQREQLLHGVYVIVNDAPQTLEIARCALAGRVRILQYRAKSGIDTQCLRALRTLTQAHDALLILNDDWRAVAEFGCDGVHLGPQDHGFTSVASVRAALGDRLIGLSCGTAQEVRRAGEADADYVGIGCVFATQSKDDAGVPIGIRGLERLAATTALPVAAIGGIDATNLPAIRRCGVAMAAVISAVAAAAAPQEAATALVDAWNAGG
jgi:thiamine-phosphate pyrophosphorylase